MHYHHYIYECLKMYIFHTKSNIAVYLYVHEYCLFMNHDHINTLYVDHLGNCLLFKMHSKIVGGFCSSQLLSHMNDDIHFTAYEIAMTLKIMSWKM